ncbi:MAG: antibiotic biosynthesis monooxygenase [Acidiferrobacterales bacterium]|nr:antibiotic biosynthesis monooxygenase [Acidiferrobacterales bacterium]
MFVITVEFLIKEAFIEPFLTAMRQQATNSLELEPDCHYFDVAVSTENPFQIFLYEIYTDKVAFEHHLNSAHFVDFNSQVSDWVERKEVNSWLLKR